MKDTVSLENWISDFAKTMALGLIKIMDEQGAEHGVEVAHSAATQFTGAFIAALTCRALGNNRIVPGTSKEQYEKVSLQLAAHKTRVQEAVAAGFAGAMSEFVGRPVEYYCLIQPVPEPVTQAIN